MASNNRILFAADDGTHGFELWVTDGTTSGTSLLKDLVPGKTGSGPGGFANVGPLVIFNATDSAHGTEPWVTDGTAAGTSLLADIRPGSASGNSSAFLAAGNVRVFTANNGSTGTELWVTDGTSAGTSLLKDIFPGANPNNAAYPATSDPRYLTPFGNRLLFQATDGYGTGAHGREVWITDGTTPGTTLLKDIAPNSGASTPRLFTDLGTGKAVFSAINNASTGRELWVTDGTTVGTSLLVNINTAAYGGSNPGHFALLGGTGRAVFAAATAASTFSSTTPVQLWVTDGTGAGTSALKTFSTGYNYGADASVFRGGEPIASVGNKAVFIGRDKDVASLWVTDGSTAGTFILNSSVTGIGGTNTHGAVSYFTQVGTRELFWSGTGLGSTPWITDGTVAGTFQLSATAQQGYRNGFTVIGNKAVFTATGSSYAGDEPWVTDGTAAGTYQLRNIFTVSGNGSSADNFTALGNQVVFAATDVSHGRELWVTDGTSGGTSLLKDINTTYYSRSSSPMTLAAVVLPCFAEGTRLQTPRGLIVVEHLREGDLVSTRAGIRPVRWIGHRAIDIGRHRDPAAVSPIRIAPHAFGDGLPHTALRLSPDHAVFADGVLIPVRRLVNGATITRENPHTITWFHVELADAHGDAIHDIVLAEGLPTESYLDTGNRDAFINGGPTLSLHPDFGRNVWAENSCARLVQDGVEIEALRSWLFFRAEILGHGRTTDPDLLITCDGVRLAPVVAGRWHSLSLPPGALRMTIATRMAIPAEVLDASDDPRRLGIGLTRWCIDHEPRELDDARLLGGWHSAETDIRWTACEAQIDVENVTHIRLALHSLPAYWSNDHVALRKVG